MIWRNSHPQSLVETVTQPPAFAPTCSPERRLDGRGRDLADGDPARPRQARLGAPGGGPRRPARFPASGHAGADHQTDTCGCRRRRSVRRRRGIMRRGLYGSRLSARAARRGSSCGRQLRFRRARGSDTTRKRPKAAARSAAPAAVSRIVVQPSGRSGSRRRREVARLARAPGPARLDRGHREAVPRVHGPKTAATVAQFCAFRGARGTGAG